MLTANQRGDNGAPEPAATHHDQNTSDDHDEEEHDRHEGADQERAAKKLSQIETAQQVLAKANAAQLQVDNRGDDQAEALVEPGGATPEATRYGSIFREIKTKGKAAQFVCLLTRRTALAAAIFTNRANISAWQIVLPFVS